MRFNCGDDVIVTFEGEEHPGEVLSCRSGYVMCSITIDPECDYGRHSSRLSPRSTVCVKEINVSLL